MKRKEIIIKHEELEEKGQTALRMSKQRHQMQ